ARPRLQGQMACRVGPDVFFHRLTRGGTIGNQEGTNGSVSALLIARTVRCQDDVVDNSKELEMWKASAPIVVGVDGSTAALTAARWAIDEAISRDVPLRIVHVA